MSVAGGCEYEASPKLGFNRTNDLELIAVPIKFKMAAGGHLGFSILKF